MFYNTYCNARVTLSDGRMCVFGGHDMQSDNGLYKINVFDPETETWIERSEPCTRSNWRTDPFGRALLARTSDAQFYDNCDPRDQQSTQPSDPSDQKYARWYPSHRNLPKAPPGASTSWPQSRTRIEICRRAITGHFSTPRPR